MKKTNLLETTKTNQKELNNKITYTENNGSVSSVPALQSRGRGFESWHTDGLRSMFFGKYFLTILSSRQRFQNKNISKVAFLTP